MSYDDGKISGDDNGLTLHGYYLWGAKTIPYSAIATFEVKPLSLLRGKWRIWGSGDFRHWYNRDAKRPTKQTVIYLNTGKAIVPAITPDRPDEVIALLSQHGVQELAN